MSGKNNSGPVVAVVAVLAVCCGMPIDMLLAAPAAAARVALAGAPNLTAHLHEWLWASLASPFLALVLVRLVLARDGRLRGGSTPVGKRWLGMLTRAAVLLATVNVATFVHLTLAGRTDTLFSDIEPIFLTVMAGVVVLAVIAAWDRRPEPVTLEEVRAAAQEADRALRRVRTQNERVRRQADQVRQRIEKLRARSHPPMPPRGRGKGPATGQRSSHRPGRPAEQPGRRSDIDFDTLRVFHRESYQVADNAHVAYESTQASLHAMSTVAHRARYMPQNWFTVGRTAKLARAEMRAAATHLAQARGELRVRVDEGLSLVRDLNANTADFKHEIRDSCGEAGRRWFEALEQRIEEARNERYVRGR